MSRFISQKVQLEVGFASIQGQRSRQEDAAAACGTRMAVFDGLGGHADGDQASLAAASSFAEDRWSSLEEAVRGAHWAVLDVRRDSQSAATTIAAVDYSNRLRWSARQGLGKGTEHHLMAVWSGDSRAYVLSKGEFKLLTRDHHNGDGLTACLGTSFYIDKITVVVSTGDIVVLTTDGVHDLLFDLPGLVMKLQDRPAQEIADAVLRQIETQARDNATILVARLP